MDESQNPLRDAPLGGADAPSGGSAPAGSADAPVEVAVTRSGGFAGITRRWRAEPPPAEASQWRELIGQCPWDAAPAVRSGKGSETDGIPVADTGTKERPGADRFVWGIYARCGEDVERETELADDELVGAWRELVDAVREWNRAEKH